MLSDRTGVDVVQVVLVVEHRALLRLFKPQQQPHQRGLAAARAPDDGHVLPRLDVQVQVIEHIGRVFIVAEGDVTHFDVSADVLNGQLLHGHLRLGLQNRLGHFQHGADGRHGNGDACQRGERAHDPPVGGGKGVVLALAHAAFHRHIIEDDRADQGNRGGDDAV